MGPERIRDQMSHRNGTVSCLLAAALVLIAAAANHAHAQEASEGEPLIAWVGGPGEAHLGPYATIQIPENYLFADGENARRFMELTGNPPTDTEVGLLVPAAQEETWFVVFEFEDIGFVKDDEKDSLDAEAILESIKAGNEAANQERRSRGWATLQILGWLRPPNYNQATHNLEWAVLGESEGSKVVNYNTRLLGRRGVMRVSLVSGPDELEWLLPRYGTLLSSYEFQRGHQYAEYRPGDKLAQYGLAALVTGGAVAVAAKTGLLSSLLKSFWKLILVVVVGAGAVIKKILGRGGSPADGSGS